MMSENFNWKPIDHPIYKYQLTDTYTHELLNPIPDKLYKMARNLGMALNGSILDGDAKPICTLQNNHMVIRAGYAWDGASWPAIDTPTFMRASGVHDAGYQMLLQYHPRLQWQFKLLFDKEMRDIALEDNMHPIRAWVDYWGVRAFGSPAKPYRPNWWLSK